MSNEIKNEGQAPNPGTKEDLKQQLAEKEAENAKLTAQLAAMKEQLEAKSAPVTTGALAAESVPQRKNIFIPRPAHSNDEQNLVVGINGKTYVLPRGQESEVPVEVAAEIERSWRAAARYDRTREQKLQETAQAEAQLKQLIN